jgi:hypothetical protein
MATDIPFDLRTFMAWQELSNIYPSFLHVPTTYTEKIFTVSSRERSATNINRITDCSGLEPPFKSHAIRRLGTVR